MLKYDGKRGALVFLFVASIIVDKYTSPKIVQNNVLDDYSSHLKCYNMVKEVRKK